MSYPRISLCVITGNEECTIERFLESFKDAFDELCIVRALGNQKHDKTLSLAKAWCLSNNKAFAASEYFNGGKSEGTPIGGAIEPYSPETWPHVDDFAAARNKAWEMATCPWQFWADLDDVLTPGGAELIRLCAAANTHDQVFFTYDLRGQSESNVRERLFRTGISKWIQPLHEQCRMVKEPESGKTWKGLIEPKVVFEHAPTQDKQRDPMRNKRIMQYHVRWIHAYAFELHREAFYQWQVSKSEKDCEEATKWAEIALNTDCLPQQRYDMLLHQAKLAAVNDAEHAIDLCWSAIRIDPKNREAWGNLAEYELVTGRAGRAAVATGFMQSIPRPQATGYPLSDRYHGWEGADLRIRSLRAVGQEESARKSEADIFRKNGSRISLLHATRGRPKQALECRNLWLKAAFVPLGVEHIFAIDEDDKESLEYLKHYRHVVIKEPRGCVKAWNAAAAESAGHVLVQLSDDWVPCHDWDERVYEALQVEAARSMSSVRQVPLVLAVSDNHRTDELLCMAILTRARYEQQGHLFYPDYFGVFSDNEFTVRAYDDGVVVKSDIVFDHRHPIFEGKPIEQWDETHRRQNEMERYFEGRAIFNARNPKHAMYSTQYEKEAALR